MEEFGAIVFVGAVVGFFVGIMIGAVDLIIGTQFMHVDRFIGIVLLFACIAPFVVFIVEFIDSGKR